MATETFTTVQHVEYDARTGTYRIVGRHTSGPETLTDPSNSVTPGTSGVTAHGAFDSNDVTYVGAVTSGGTVEGYIVKYTGSFGIARYEYVSSGAPLGHHAELTVNSSTDNLTLCFMAGTMIATPAGATAVETLCPGDLVSLAAGGAAPIAWLGRQTIAPRFADPLRAQPIRVMAHALGDGMPARDLLISPDHALLVDGLLVHAGALVNGVSIRRETDLPEMFTYYHIELADHALILAENTPAETFIDHAGRLAFDNWEEHPRGADLVEMDLPRAKSARQLPMASRARLAERGAALYGPPGDTAAA
jgi:Hint domain